MPLTKETMVGLALLAVVFMTGPPAAAEEEKPQAPEAPPVKVSRAASAIKIDGVLDEPAWAAAAVIELSYETRPAENQPPPVKTGDERKDQAGRLLERELEAWININGPHQAYISLDGGTRERVFKGVSFSYKLNPQTVLFAGYSDNLFGDERVDLTRNDRTFFLKLGYAWVP